MGILNRLWGKVVNDEKRAIEREYDQRLRDLYEVSTARFELRLKNDRENLEWEKAERLKKLPVRKAADSMGGVEVGNPHDAHVQALAHSQMNLMRQHAAMQLNAATATGTPSWVSATQATSTGSSTLGSIYSGVGASTTGIVAHTPTGLTTLQAGGYSHVQPPPVFNMRSLGDNARDTFFLALKGIEEAAMKKPEGNHRYDDLAVEILDLRNFTGKVPLLNLASFCVSNLIDVEPLVILLRGYGIEVV